MIFGYLGNLKGISLISPSVQRNPSGILQEFQSDFACWSEIIEVHFLPRANQYLFSWKLNALKCNSDHKIKSIFVFKIKTLLFQSRILLLRNFLYSVPYKNIFFSILFSTYISLSKVATRCLEKISWKQLWFHKEFDPIMFYFFQVQVRHQRNHRITVIFLRKQPECEM